MIYSRFPHRNVAITVLYLVLTVGVLGLLIIVCIFNDTEHNYLFGSESRNEMQLPSSADLKYRNYNKSSTKNILNKTTEYQLKNYSNYDEDEQHIYIDELYTESMKPINYRKTEITTERPRRMLNNSEYYLNHNRKSKENQLDKFGGINSDSDDSDSDDNENKSFYQNEFYNDNENVASGSGDGLQFMKLHYKNSNTNDRININRNGNENFDIETQKFIKRIGKKLLRLSNKNTTDRLENSKDRNKNRNRYRYRFRSSTLESKINRHRSLVLTTSSPSLKLGSSGMEEWRQQPGSFPVWAATQTKQKTRRIIGNEKKSAERSRQLLLCEKGKSGGSGSGSGGGDGGGGGGELCRMLFKET